MYIGFLHMHKFVVTLFLVHYVVKLILLLTGKEEKLNNYTAKTKIAEMVISFLFLATGIGMLIINPNFTTLQYMKISFVLGSIPLAIIGFKKKNKALAIISVVMIFLAYGLAEMNKKAAKVEIELTDNTNPENPTYDINAHGKQLYSSYCETCHGADGKKGLAGAKDLSISALDDAQKTEVISNGKNAMAAYKSAMNEQEIKAVVSYINQLK